MSTWKYRDIGATIRKCLVVDVIFGEILTRLAEAGNNRGGPHKLPAEGGQRCGFEVRRRCRIIMLEAIVIIVALGGLELILWYFDHRQQKKQIELLDSIWAELAIRNSAEEEAKKGFLPAAPH